MKKDGSNKVEEIIPYLLHWYDYNRRILPWREDPTPYHVWVSEIMLQQTRVEAVKGYYDRFLASLPDIKALAEAEEEKLLKLWEGLGYYNRVRNMQKAARILVEQYGGEMPADYETIRSLPGIGDYTAGAIASIAFGLPYPAVDGNVLRVISRITCSEEDIAKEATKQKLKQDLINVYQEKTILYGDFNQSLMELGATVCLPNGKPLCDTCPVMHLCKAFHAGRETELPVKSGKKERRIEKRQVLVLSYEGKFLLHKREKKGLLSGLWEFPNVLQTTMEADALPVTGVPAAEKDLLQRIAGGANETEGLSFSIKKQKKAKHIFSHVEWHMEGILVECECTRDMEEQRLIAMVREWMLPDDHKGNKESVQKEAVEDFVFVTPGQIKEEYSVPSAFSAFLEEVMKEDPAESME